VPFTPFHFGPGILLGLLLLKKMDFPIFVAANIIIDWRTFLVFFGLWERPLHGWVHTYIGATIMAIILGSVMTYIRPLIYGQLREMKIVQEVTKRKIFLAAFSGTFLHVTLDAFHHPYMQTFMPLDIRPLYGLMSTSEIRLVTFSMLLLSFPVYIYIIRKEDWNKKLGVK